MMPDRNTDPGHGWRATGERHAGRPEDGNLLNRNVTVLAAEWGGVGAAAWDWAALWEPNSPQIRAPDGSVSGGGGAFSVACPSLTSSSIPWRSEESTEDQTTISGRLVPSRRKGEVLPAGSTHSAPSDTNIYWAPSVCKTHRRHGKRDSGMRKIMTRPSKALTSPDFAMK